MKSRGGTHPLPLKSVEFEQFSEKDFFVPHNLKFKSSKLCTDPESQHFTLHCVAVNSIQHSMSIVERDLYMESIIRNDVPQHVNTSWVLKQNDYIFVCRRKVFIEHKEQAIWYRPSRRRKTFS